MMGMRMWIKRRIKSEAYILGWLLCGLSNGICQGSRVELGMGIPVALLVVVAEHDTAT